MAWERVLDLGRDMRCENCGRGGARLDSRRASFYEADEDAIIVGAD